MIDARPDIIVVDDDPSIRAIVADLFALEGFAVRVAEDGEEALRLVRERRPAVIVLDYSMPRMNGAAFCGAFAGELGRDGTSIVLLTAAADRDLAFIRELCAAEALVRKPFDVDDLLATVAALHPDGGRLTSAGSGDVGFTAVPAA
jgi:DNA-binding response OmpR family regulator